MRSVEPYAIKAASTKRKTQCLKTTDLTSVTDNMIIRKIPRSIILTVIRSNVLAWVYSEPCTDGTVMMNSE